MALMVSGLIGYVICSWSGDMYHWPPLWIAPQFFSDIFQGKWSLQVEFNISNSDEREQFSMHSNCLLFLCAFDMPCYVLITLSRCSEVEIIVFGYITGAGLWSCKFAVVWHSEFSLGWQWITWATFILNYLYHIQTSRLLSTAVIDYLILSTLSPDFSAFLGNVLSTS